MTLSDTIGDALTRIRNAKQAKLRYADLMFSNMNMNILNVLKINGYIDDFKDDKDNYKIRVFLRYSKKDIESAIQEIKRVSKPGLRKYVGYKEIPEIYNGFGIAILSTSKGILCNKKAKELKVGGELLCFVW